MSVMTKPNYRMSPSELQALDRDGYIVREGVFSPAECGSGSSTEVISGKSTPPR